MCVDFSRRRARVARLLSCFFKMAAPVTKFEAYFKTIFGRAVTHLNPKTAKEYIYLYMVFDGEDKKRCMGSGAYISLKLPQVTDGRNQRILAF